MIEGPRLPATLQSAGWFFGRIAFARGCARRYGRCFRIELLGFGSVVVVADPAALRCALAGEDGALAAGEANSFGGLIAELAGADSILLRDGADHQRLRSALEPALEAVAPRVEEHARAAARGSIVRWPRGRPFALMPELERVSLEVFAAAVLGATGERRTRAVEVMAEWAGSWNNAQVLLPWLRGRRGNRRRWRRFGEARAALRGLFATELGRAGDGGSVAGCLRAEGALAAEEIQALLLSLLVAGHAPTANGMGWSVELLLRSPAALERLRESLAAGEEGYLDAVVKEGLRMRPVGQWMARRVTAPVDICGGRVEAGELLVPNAFLAHHDESLHEAAGCFRPERFLGGDGAQQAWLPFGVGERRCPGAGFAEAQLRGLLREVVTGIDLAPGRRRPERLVPDGVSLVPKHGVVVVAGARPAGPAPRRRRSARSRSGNRRRRWRRRRY